MTEPISNRQARHALMRLTGLAGERRGPLRGEALHALVHNLGYVQLDSINVVERAHHHILHSRGAGYRPAALKRLVEKDRLLFEHWTHDASVVPMAFYPYWQHRFERARTRLRPRYEKFFANGFAGELDRVLERVRSEGPVRSRDFDGGERRDSAWWNWHPSKTALEYLWHTGELAIAGREGFQKVYDLTERVIPETARTRPVEHDAFIDWVCREALKRLGFATRGEIAAFFQLLSPAEIDAWIAANAGDLVKVGVATVEGKPRSAFALREGFDALTEPVGIADAVRILSPFDPLLRDRARTERIFGFLYRIEIFVPEAKRQYGYYVFPVMRGDAIVGRIDMKADRAVDRLAVRKFWPEPGVRTSAVLKRKMEAEIDRLRRLAGVAETGFAGDWFG
jgi:uncharacterized protein YcaQ